MLEADERFVFTLDGQLQTVDDYLEIRPENEARIRSLVESGRLAVGPWQVLMDEFLVSGETIWRNLERGLARGDALGGAMRVGYLPDQFGHTAQMPQILRAHGLESAVVWRGVPHAVDSHTFEWSAPDGSSVRAEYLPSGYWNAAYLLLAPDRLSTAVSDLVDAMAPWFDGDPVLAMYGTDHAEPLPDLVDVVDEANGENGRVHIELRTLADALAGQSARTAPTWAGELRSGARANLLPNVTSARMDIKAAASRAERALERYAEPFAALHGRSWPHEFLDVAWRRVIENSAHDSICGCSADPVSAHVLVRYNEAEALAKDLAREALAEAVALTPRGAAVVANPSPFARADLVELELPVPEGWRSLSLELPNGGRVDAQELDRNMPHLHRAMVRGGEIPQLLRRRLHGRELFGRWLNGFAIEQGPRLVLDVDTEQDPLWLDIPELRSEIEVAANAHADEDWEVVLRTRPRRRVLANVPAPALGWTSVRAVNEATNGLSRSPATVDGGALTNGLIRFELADLGAIARGGDVGDSYNYAPPSDDVLVREPESESVELLEHGPLRARALVTRTYRWLPDDPVAIETLVELRAGEPFVRLRIAFDNRAEDQRVRLHIPLARDADRSFAEGQYGVVERSPVAEGGYGEVPLPTHPAHSFVAAGGVAVLLDHALEYELVGPRELAVTLLRSTGFISRNTNPYREDPAGPEVAIPDAQMRGPWSVSLALYPYAGDRPGPDVLEQAERFRLPFLALAGAGEGELRDAAGWTLEGDGVVLTALRRRGDELEARVVNETPVSQRAVVDGAELELRPWEIRTVTSRADSDRRTG